MATQELRKRSNWQKISGARALKTEELFHQSLQIVLDAVYPDQFLIDRHPKEFSDIYSTYDLPDDVLNKIYNVDVREKNQMVIQDTNGESQWILPFEICIMKKYYLVRLNVKMDG